jgi:MFS family permease
VSDRIGAKKVLLIGFALFSLVYLFFGLIVRREYVWLLFPAYGIYMALTEGVGKAYIANLVPQENAGAAFGVYQTATGVCTLFASIFAGLMWTHINVQAPFIFGSIMAILAGLLFLLT